MLFKEYLMMKNRRLSFFTYIKHTLVKVCIEIKTKQKKQAQKKIIVIENVYSIYIYI